MPAEAASLPTFHFPDGSSFIAQQRMEEIVPPFITDDENQLRSWLASRWSMAFEGKRAETERLKLNSLYYDGFHYQSAWLNRTNPITNYCFSTVETVVPFVTEVSPRPEIMPRRSMDAERIARLQEFATWLMDRDEFDDALVCGTRDKSKYGWCAYLVTFDYVTGMPYPKNLSVFDFYPDPTARNQEELEFFFLAMPVSTDRLQALYPHLASRIVPDGMAGPAYDVHTRPFFEFMENAHRYETPNMVTGALSFTLEGDPQPTTSTSLVASMGNYREHGKTTLLLQLFARCDLMKEVKYLGSQHVNDESGEPGDTIEVEGMEHSDFEAVSESGWMVISMTNNGVFLTPPVQKGEKPLLAMPMDNCYGGLPIELCFRYKQTDRMWCPGELDHIIPLQREINRRKKNIAKALELSANPPIVTNFDSGLAADTSTVEAGEVLRIKRGSELRWLEFSGPSQFQFATLEQDTKAVQIVSGQPDAMMGQRPVGIEAASAIRNLQQGAAVRLRGMEAVARRERSRLLKKLMIAAGHKLQPGIMFKATNGAMMTVSPDDLLDEYDIRFADGTGTQTGRESLEEKAMALFDRQAIDVPALLEAVNWPGREEVAARVQQMQLLEMKMKAEAMAKAGAGGGPPQNRGK